MNCIKILLYMTVLVCIAFQACAESDPLGGSSSSSTMGSGRDYLSPPWAKSTHKIGWKADTSEVTTVP